MAATLRREANRADRIAWELESETFVVSTPSTRDRLHKLMCAQRRLAERLRKQADKVKPKTNRRNPYSWVRRGGKYAT